MKKRNEIPAADTWRLEDMVESDETWETLFSRTRQEISGYGQLRGCAGRSADDLYRCLVFDEEMSKKVELLYVYARMRSDQDTGNQKYQEMFGRAETLSYEDSRESSFLVPEILEIPEGKLQAFMNAEPGLGHFKRDLDQLLAKKPHTLDAEQEELLAASA